MTARVVLECGCPVIAHHTEGTASFTCKGGGFGSNDETGSVRRLRRCPGGLKHEVTAEVVETVRFESRIIDPEEAA